MPLSLERLISELRKHHAENPNATPYVSRPAEDGSVEDDLLAIEAVEEDEGDVVLILEDEGDE